MAISGEEVPRHSPAPRVGLWETHHRCITANNWSLLPNPPLCTLCSAECWGKGYEVFPSAQLISCQYLSIRVTKETRNLEQEGSHNPWTESRMFLLPVSTTC